MEVAKQKLGIQAGALVESGQIVGLGTGSTAAFAIKEIGRRVREEGLQIKCVATSAATYLLAQDLGLFCLPLGELAEVDISIDGADEVDPQFYLLKGGGGAHTLEKLVHTMSKRFVTIADSSKKVRVLGERFPIPVEILPQAQSFVSKKLKELGALELSLRPAAEDKEEAFVTDSGNWILDARFPISDPMRLEQEIKQICGVLENGIFAQTRPEPQNCLIA